MERALLTPSAHATYVRGRATVRGADLAVLRFRKALSFTDKRHIVQCLATTMEVQAPVAAQEGDACNQVHKLAVKKCKDDDKSVKCKTGEKIIKEQAKVLKGIQAEKKKFAKLMDVMRQQGTAADDLLLAQDQFNQLESTLQKLMGGVAREPAAAGCMEDSSSSSSSSSDSDVQVMSMRKNASMIREGITPMQSAACAVLDPVTPDNVMQQIPDNSTPVLDGLPAQPASAYVASGQVLVCQGKKCSAAGAREILAQASRLASGSNVEVLPCKCLGKCKMAPAMRLQTGDEPSSLFTDVDVRQVHAMMQAAFGAEETQLNVEHPVAPQPLVHVHA